MTEEVDETEPGRAPDLAAGAEPGRRPAVKVCGLRHRADVEVAVEAGASFLGLVFARSPRQVYAVQAAELVEGTGARAVGVFVDDPPPEVLRTAEVAKLDVVQLHGDESPEVCDVVRGTGVEVWKALSPRSREELAAEADRYEGAVDGLLVEGRSEEAAGGTGTGFPHRWVTELGLTDPERDGAALILAGGLTPENVGEAVREVRPHVVDVSSGVESAPGEKDPELIRRFVRSARRL